MLYEPKHLACPNLTVHVLSGRFVFMVPTAVRYQRLTLSLSSSSEIPKQRRYHSIIRHRGSFAVNSRVAPRSVTLSRSHSTVQNSISVHLDRDFLGDDIDYAAIFILRGARRILADFGDILVVLQQPVVSMARAIVRATALDSANADVAENQGVKCCPCLRYGVGSVLSTALIALAIGNPSLDPLRRP